MDWKVFGKEPLIPSFKAILSCNLEEGLSKTTKHLVTLFEIRILSQTTLPSLKDVFCV